MQDYEIVKTKYVKSNWIEITTTDGRLKLLNLDNIDEISINRDIVSIYPNAVEIEFDKKFDSLVDFINSKKVSL